MREWVHADLQTLLSPSVLSADQGSTVVVNPERYGLAWADCRCLAPRTQFAPAACIQQTHLFTQPRKWVWRGLTVGAWRQESHLHSLHTNPKTSVHTSAPEPHSMLHIATITSLSMHSPSLHWPRYHSIAYELYLFLVHPPVLRGTSAPQQSRSGCCSWPASQVRIISMHDVSV